jgi:hypothetical protein
MAAKHAFQGTSTKLQDGNAAFTSLQLQGGDVVSLNDYVLVSALDDTSGAPPFVAKIVRMWHNAVSLTTFF